MQTAHLQLDPTTCLLMFSSKRLELPSTTLTLSKTQRKSLRDLYQKYNFKSKSIDKIILTLFQYGEGEVEEDAQFENVLTAHITRSLRAGMPSLHKDICALIRSNEKSSSNVFLLDAYDVKRHPVLKLALRLVTSFIDNLKKYSLFTEPPQGILQNFLMYSVFDKGFHHRHICEAEEPTNAVLEPPTALLWASYLKSTLLEICGDIDGAISCIDEVSPSAEGFDIYMLYNNCILLKQCILHTPTAIDMYCKRSKLLKKQGNVARAAGICPLAALCHCRNGSYDLTPFVLFICRNYGRVPATGFTGPLSQ